MHPKVKLQYGSLFARLISIKNILGDGVSKLQQTQNVWHQTWCILFILRDPEISKLCRLQDKSWLTSLCFYIQYLQQLHSLMQKIASVLEYIYFTKILMPFSSIKFTINKLLCKLPSYVNMKGMFGKYNLMFVFYKLVRHWSRNSKF